MYEISTVTYRIVNCVVLRLVEYMHAERIASPFAIPRDSRETWAMGVTLPVCHGPITKADCFDRAY